MTLTSGMPMAQLAVVATLRPIEKKPSGALPNTPPIRKRSPSWLAVASAREIDIHPAKVSSLLQFNRENRGRYGAQIYVRPVMISGGRIETTSNAK